MDLTIAQTCPTCGAPITLHEDDRLLLCPFCEVQNYLVHRLLARFALPAKACSTSKLFYAPYLRCKGILYYCLGKEVGHAIIDTTRLAVDMPDLPVSLGLRPQAMQLIPVTSNLPGGFLKHQIKAQALIEQAMKLPNITNPDSAKNIIHKAFIGETFSTIYLPLYLEHGTLYDGVLCEPLNEEGAFKHRLPECQPSQASWEPHFLSTLCPQCGETMVGSKDTLVMECRNCQTCWHEVNGQFQKVAWTRVQSKQTGAIYLPFWRIEVADEHLRLRTFADFLQWTNQPIVIRAEHHQQQLTFMVPAFKVNPMAFLQIAKNMTMIQMNIPEGEQESMQTVHPVTLAVQEAVQALKSIFAAAAISPQKIIDHLTELLFLVVKSELVYLPFRDSGHDLVQEQTGVVLVSAALRYGRSL